MDEREVARIQLTEAHQRTRGTKHFYGLPGDPDAVAVPAPSMLGIVQLEGDAGFYLFYCDDSGVELTDTYHESYEAAQDQAEFESAFAPRSGSGHNCSRRPCA